MKKCERWHSERLHRPVTLARWGAWGRPVLILPTAGGDAEEIERFGLIDALGGLIHDGKIKVYSCDSVAGQALLGGEGSPEHQMYLQDAFHYYIRDELVPAIWADCGGQALEVWTAGASIGAFHAVALVCRFPDVFGKACAMSGSYDLRRFFHTEQFTGHFWGSSPLHFLPAVDRAHLDHLRTRFVLMACGEGQAENIGESWAMAHALGERGVPNRVDPWGPSWDHDWPTWRVMLPQYLHEWTR